MPNGKYFTFFKISIWLIGIKKSFQHLGLSLKKAE